MTIDNWSLNNYSDYIAAFGQKKKKKKKEEHAFIKRV